MPAILIALTLLLLGGTAANAACTCQCVDGQFQPICDGTVSPPIVCKPTVCRPPRPAIAPPVIAPAGCRQARVCEQDGKSNCRWELVCR